VTPQSLGRRAAGPRRQAPLSLPVPAQASWLRNPTFRRVEAG
jgi:hypothetical protein